MNDQAMNMPRSTVRLGDRVDRWTAAMISNSLKRIEASRKLLDRPVYPDR
jgi:hypothetical protein